MTNLKNNCSEEQIINYLINFCDENHHILNQFVNQIMEHTHYGRFVIVLIDNEVIDEARYYKNFNFDDHYSIEDIIAGNFDDEFESDVRSIQNSIPYISVSIIYTSYNESNILVELHKNFDIDSNEFVGDFYLSPDNGIDNDYDETVDDYRLLN